MHILIYWGIQISNNILTAIAIIDLFTHLNAVATEKK